MVNRVKMGEKREIPKGTFSGTFRRFCRSADRTMRIVYDSTDDAVRAQKAMLNLMNREKIFNIIIKRRRNVMCLEKDRIRHEAEYEHFRNQIMRKFLEIN